MKLNKLLMGLMISLAPALMYAANVIDVPVSLVDADGKLTPIGTVTISESEYGLMLAPNLKGLPPGLHGFHFHEKSSCANTVMDNQVTVAGAAGGHWDPEHNAKHAGPYGQGHMGDLPSLFVAADGTATIPVLAPRIRSEDKIHGLALMIHAGGDNLSDQPAKLGGGGARIACGVIP